ncbi:hypothetical protein FRC03_006634 [Tulasnella sp. 419]|nr:hypothetical protein FRC03_006634 [Tulasnella sp. 419]
MVMSISGFYIIQAGLSILSNHDRGFEEIPSERRIASRLGNKVKSIALQTSGISSLLPPLDEILAILHALSESLERLIINPDQLMPSLILSKYDSSGEFDRDELSRIFRRFRTALEGLKNLEEYCDFGYEKTNLAGRLPIGCCSSLKRLIVFGRYSPYQITTTMSLFNNLEKFAVIARGMEIEVAGSRSEEDMKS